MNYIRCMDKIRVECLNTSSGVNSIIAITTGQNLLRCITDMVSIFSSLIFNAHYKVLL
jgi:hypothetical protein